MHIEPFKIHITDDAIDDLKRRLRCARLPQSLDRNAWDDGASLAFMERLLAYWLHEFDWRRQESRLNELSHFVADVNDLSIHFVHEKGNGPKPLPLILTHGWPGSFVEMERIIPLLTDPQANGGSAEDAFSIVVPSLPGYAFSQSPKTSGIGSHEIASMWHQLMQGLGYEVFGAQGGDIGAGVSSWLGRLYPENIVGLHLNFLPGSYQPPLGDDVPPVSGEEQAFLDRSAQWASAEGAYAHLHATKPQTISFSLADSPMGLAAWIVEKFRAWSDCDGDVLNAFSMDEILTDISLYWFNGTIDASLRLYKEGRARPFSFESGERVKPPLAFAQFPKEISAPPRSWVERAYTVTRWTNMPKGGHFAAMEQPELLAEDIRAHFRALR